MSSVKHVADEHLEKIAAATEIAKKAGVLSYCEWHHYVFVTGKSDYENAYKISNKMVTDKDPLVCVFKWNRRELTNLIKQIASFYGLCLGCQAMLKE